MARRAASGDREVPHDPAAEERERAARAARIEAQKQAARERAAKSHQRRKAAKKASRAQTSARPPAAAAENPAAAAGGDESPLGKLLEEEDAGAAEDEAAAAAAVNEAFGTPAKVAAFLCTLQGLAAVSAARSPRAIKVVQALNWAGPDGQPTPDCLMGVQLAWPWLESGGLAYLALLGNGFMASLGAGLLFGPAIVVAFDEYQAHKAARGRAAAEDATVVIGKRES